MALCATKTTTSTRNGAIREPNGSFKRFDVVSDHSDHYYSILNKDGGGGKVGGVFANGFSSAHKKIMQEWKILESHLPDSIYVRVYETRIDLLRAVLVGATGTPYHDSLFFFDIAFPPDYPASPPKVHYRSFGYRLNPNLYGGGDVCLSLLNTWYGDRREKWNPSQSTILQVLVSIQALVLNEKPYFNEPGHGKFGRAQCEIASRAYNESVFILTCKTTLLLLRIPPRNFEAFTREHFRQRASAILRACSAYANGRVAVGYYKDGEDDDGVGSVTKVRQNFRVSMRLVYPKLFAAFQMNGASLGSLVKHLKVEGRKKNKRSYTTPREAQGQNNIVKRAIAKLKEVLGFGSKKKENDKKMIKQSGSGSKRNAGVAAAEA